MSIIQLPAFTPKRPPWNKGRHIGQKRRLLAKQVWAIRALLELSDNLRDLALFNLATDSKLRGCDLVRLKVTDLVIGDRVRERVTVVQSKTRFVMDAPSARLDDALIANVARGHAWLEQIKAGKTIAEIADNEGSTRRRVQQVLEFAFLAPDVTRDILAGKQPMGLTSTWIMTHRLPISWDDQRALIATLQAF